MDRARAVWPRVIEVSQPAAPTTCEPTEPGLMNGILPFSSLPMKNYCCCLWLRPEGGGRVGWLVSRCRPTTVSSSLFLLPSRSRTLCLGGDPADGPRYSMPRGWCTESLSSGAGTGDGGGGAPRRSQLEPFRFSTAFHCRSTRVVLRSRRTRVRVSREFKAVSSRDGGKGHTRGKGRRGRKRVQEFSRRGYARGRVCV